MAIIRASETGLDRSATSWQLPIADQSRLPLYLLVFSVLYFLAAKLGIATSLPPANIVTVWPPNAITLVTLLAVNPKHWWTFFIATVATEIAADVPAYPLWAAAGYGVVNFFEAATAAFLMLRFISAIPPIAGLAAFARFVLIGPVLASGVAALVGAAIYKLGSPSLDYLHYWRVFWFGDALGLLVVGTCLLSVFRVPLWWNEVRLAKVLEGVALIACLTGAIFWAFYAGSEMPRVYVIFPVLLWASVRFGIHGASLAVLATIASAMASANAGVGPFTFLTVIDRVTSLQSLIAIIALATFFLAFTIEDFWLANARLKAEVAEHNRTAAKLNATMEKLELRNSELDDIVAERTADLRTTLGRNENLLHEMYHRVKNSLHMISAMVRVQGRTGSVHELVGKVTTQIGAIGTVYDMMHQMGSVESTNLFAIVSDLCKRLSDSVGGSATLKCETDGQAVVTANTAVSLGLALNELITNSIKHSNSSGNAVIHVSCRREGYRALITISDNGPGFPAGFDIERATGFGLRMAQRVVSQEGGEIHLATTAEGSEVKISFPVNQTARNQPT
jgi:two-component sensor histidine kinase/integral membrane sensor domain MASE1